MTIEFVVKSSWEGRNDGPSGDMVLEFDGVVYRIPLRSFQEYHAVIEYKNKEVRKETKWVKEQLKHLMEEI